MAHYDFFYFFSLFGYLFYRLMCAVFVNLYRFLFEMQYANKSTIFQ
jgi:hypothetical protein